MAFPGSLFVNLQGALPVVDDLFPAGGRIGTTVSVIVGGKIEPWPPGIWSSSPGLKWAADPEKGKLIVEISTNAPSGPHLIRFFNDEGGASLRCFMVGEYPEVLDEEPNDNATKAQRLSSLPVTINGRLGTEGDTDSFQIELEAGQWLVASVDAYSLDSPVDPMLHVLDRDGTRVAFNHDGQSLDPFLTYQAATSGTYVLQLSAFAYPPKADIRLTGGSSCVYRLTVSNGPVAQYSFPAGIRRGHKEVLQVGGWNLGTKSGSLVVEADASNCDSELTSFSIDVPGAPNRLRVQLGDLPEVRELEPNDEGAVAQPIRVPCVVNGRIDPEGDRDRFRYEAKKGERFEFRIRSQSLGFPLDAVLSVHDADGKQLARSDDSGKDPDPSLSWSAPADGSYTLAIEDLIQRGRSDFVYRLEIDHPEAGFDAEVLSDVFAVEPGKTSELKLNVSRLHGFEGTLVAIVEGLPGGVSSTTAMVPAKGGEVKLSLIASEEAKPSNSPIRALVVATDPRKPEVRVVASKLKGKNTPAGDLVVNESESIWLTVLPKPANATEDSKGESKD